MRSDKITDAAAHRIVVLEALGRLVFMRGCFVVVFDVLGILFFLHGHISAALLQLIAP